MKHQRLTLIEVLVVIGVIIVISGMLLPVLIVSREKSRRVNCAGNLKSIGLALLMYSGDNGGYFPVANQPDDRNFEPLNTQDVLDDGKVYSCPSADVLRTLSMNSAYSYRGSGLVDDNKTATEITMAYDRSGNHPDNKWMNALFIDGHAEGAKPDGNKPGNWNLQAQ